LLSPKLRVAIGFIYTGELVKMLPARALLAVLPWLVLGMSACGEEPVDTKPAAPAPTVTVTAQVTQNPAREESDAPGTNDENGVVGDSGTSGGETFVMPDEKGKTLQAAQDDLQAVSGNPVFYSGSEDATGADRGQILDSGWRVCDQRPRVGTEVRDDEDDVLLYVVRTSESCP
jgi:hypothetical protein